MHIATFHVCRSRDVYGTILIHYTGDIIGGVIGGVIGGILVCCVCPCTIIGCYLWKFQKAGRPRVPTHQPQPTSSITQITSNSIPFHEPTNNMPVPQSQFSQPKMDHATVLVPTAPSQLSNAESPPPYPGVGFRMT